MDFVGHEEVVVLVCERFIINGVNSAQTQTILCGQPTHQVSEESWKIVWV